MKKRIVVETWKKFDELDKWQLRAEYKEARKNTYLVNSYYDETDEKLFNDLNELTGKYGFTFSISFGDKPKIEVLNNDNIFWDDAGECFQLKSKNPTHELLDFIGELNIEIANKISDVLHYYIDLITRSLSDDVVFEMWLDKYWEKIGEEFLVSRQVVGEIDE